MGSRTGASVLDNDVREDLARLTILPGGDTSCDLTEIVSGLKDDQVTLVRQLTQPQADRIVFGVAAALGLSAQLELQAEFASVHGHRSRVGKYFMTVNERTDYQFIPPHSEGDAKAAIQLACFHCLENTTDGGATILLNADDDSSMWALTRSAENKVSVGNRKLSASEIAIARMRYQIRIPEDLLGDDDEVVSEQECPIPGLKMFKVLARTSKTHSRILDRDVNVYWDNVSSVDFDCSKEYLKLLRSDGLLKEPPQGIDVGLIDYNHDRRVRSSGINYKSLFKAKIVRKLEAGDLVIFNNLTWAHSNSNWTPHSGHRRLAAAFA
jgi:hypothetical protein